MSDLHKNAKALILTGIVRWETTPVYATILSFADGYDPRVSAAAESYDATTDFQTNKAYIGGRKTSVTAQGNVNYLGAPFYLVLQSASVGYTRWMAMFFRTGDLYYGALNYKWILYKPIPAETLAGGFLFSYPDNVVFTL